MVISSLDGSYCQMVKPLQENFIVKVFLDNIIVNTMN